MKFYDKANLCGAMDDITDEFQLLTDLDHPKVARTYELFEDRRYVYVINEPYFGGDLSTCQEKAQENGVQITEGWLAKILKQACDGLAYLHSKDFMHCDLKEPNVMITGKSEWQNPNVVLIDFGMSQNFSGGARCGGTPGFMPPEVVQYGMWTPKGDIFSMGVMFFRLYCFEQVTPFSGNTVEAIMQAVCVQEPPWQYLNSSPALCALVRRMLTRDFHNRPNIKQVCNDQWFVQCQASGGGQIDKSALKALSGHKRKSDLHQALMADMAGRENLAQLQGINELFMQLDKDNDGVVTADEARDGLRRIMDPASIDNLINGLIGANGEIPYTEFMGQMIAQTKAEETELLWKVFQDADDDDSNYLDRNELKNLLQRPEVAKCLGGDQTADELMAQMDTNNSGRVSFEEFRRVIEGDEKDKSIFKKGDSAEYYSTTHSCWVPCKIEEVHKSGAVIISVKPGCWIKKAQFPGKLRAASGKGCSSKGASGMGLQLLHGGLGM